MNQQQYRIEKDAFGEVRIPADRLWGPTTQRCLENFDISEEKMPREIIRAFAVLKRAAALTNARLGGLDQKRAFAIAAVCDRIFEGGYAEEFPLPVWQTGSGAQTDMNVNEVISHLTGLHPDDINRGQSSNDTFPTAMHIAFVMMTESDLLPAISLLRSTFSSLAGDYREVIKVGRTHLMDATPLTLGQEISAWVEMLDVCAYLIESVLEPVRELALGGTIVGTGYNSHPDFGEVAAHVISKYTGFDFRAAPNKFHAISSMDTASGLHGALNTLATDLIKIANDIRWLASGPRCGIGELIIPANEPGSTAMPGKVNPSQCEALTMAAARVIGNDVAVGFGSSQGNFQLNTYLPVIAYSVIQSIRLLADAIRSFNDRCAIGIRPNLAFIAYYLNQALMLVAALTPRIGYERAAEITKYAYETGFSLRDAIVGRGILSNAEFDRLVDPKNMI